MNPNESSKTCNDCSCQHHWVGPVALMLIGVAFLLQSFGWLSSGVVDMAWPILLIVYGGTKFCKCC